MWGWVCLSICMRNLCGSRLCSVIYINEGMDPFTHLLGAVPWPGHGIKAVCSLCSISLWIIQWYRPSNGELQGDNVVQKYSFDQPCCFPHFGLPAVLCGTGGEKRHHQSPPPYRDQWPGLQPQIPAGSVGSQWFRWKQMDKCHNGTRYTFDAYTLDTNV